MTINHEKETQPRPLDIPKNPGDFSPPSPAAPVDLRLPFAHLKDSNSDGRKDTVKFAKNITLDNIDSSFEGDDLVIQLDKFQPDNFTDARITLKGWRTNKSWVNGFELDDGTQLSTGEFLTTLGTDDHDLIKWFESGLKINTKKGHDKLYLGPFKHDIQTGDGDDIISVALGGSGIFRGGKGDDTIHVNTSPGAPINDTRIFGDSGEDTILGGQGNDVMDGGKDNDKLMGDLGNDILEGGPGDDILHGGLNDDVMAGGDDNDTYIYNLGDGNAFISDVPKTDSPSHDKLIFGAGIIRSNTKAYALGADIVFFPPGGGLVRIIGFTNPKYTIEEIIFDGGRPLSSSDIDSTTFSNINSMTSSEINSIIQSMAAFNQDNGIELPGIDYGMASDDVPLTLAYNWQE